MRRSMTMRRVSWLVVCVPLLLGQAAPQTRPQEDIETLIRQLDSDRWAERERATSELARRGPSVAGPLKAALKAGRLPLEAKRRAEWVLFRIEVPESGTVWRDTPHAEPYEGIKEGDVVVDCDGTPVRTADELSRVLEVKQYEMSRLKVWRRDEGYFEAVVARDIPRMAGFRTWPDAQELYTRFGQKGDWDGDVLKALRLTHEGKPEARQSYQAAWDAGCRDSLVAASWLWELRTSGSNEEAQKLWDQKLKGQIKSTQPGGFWRYGEIPHQLWHLQLVRGRREEAIRLVAEAIEQAIKADAWQGLVHLRTVQFELKVGGPPGEALKFWQEHLRTALQGIPEPRYDLAVLLAERLASEGDPQLAANFVKELPNSVTKVTLEEYYRGQVELAKAAREFKTDWPYMVPVKWVESVGPLESSLVGSEFYLLGVLRRPARIDCETRIVSFPAGRSPWARIASMILNGKESRSIAAIISLDWAGCTYCKDGVRRAGMESRSSAILNPNQWQALSVEVQPILTRMAVNGRTRRTTYHSQPDSEDLNAFVSCSGSTAEFRNITLYVGSKVKTDNAAVLRLLRTFSHSIDSLDLKAAEESSRKLADILNEVPEAKLHVAEIAAATARLRAMRSAEGFDLCSQQIVGAADHRNGSWEFRDGCLVGKRNEWGKFKGAILHLRQRLPEFELSGVADFRNRGKNTQVSIFWNGPDDVALVNHGPHAWIWPVHGEVGLVERPDGGKPRGSWHEVELTGPVAFCLRVRGQAGTLFIHDGKKPVVSVSDFKSTGRNLYIWCAYLEKDTEVRFNDLVLRHLPKDRKLDAPAELPKVPNKQPQSQPAK